MWFTTVKEKYFARAEELPELLPAEISIRRLLTSV
jgi:hypothetical protein